MKLFEEYSEYTRFKKYQNEHREDLGNYSEIKKERINLPVDIFVDEAQTFVNNNHKPWLLFRNGYNREYEFVPIEVSKTPRLAFNIPLKIENSDLDKLLKFVSSFNKELVDLSYNKISFRDFLTTVRNNFQLFEMATLSPKESGVPLKIWCDYEQHDSKHKGPRIKFENPKGESNTRRWMELLLPSKEYIQVKNGNISQDNIKKIIKVPKDDLKKLFMFVDKNMDLLTELTLGNIDKEYFLDHAFIIDTNGNFKEPIVKDDVECENQNFSLTKVKNSKGKFNFKKEDGELLSPEKWFDVANSFKKTKDGKIRAYVEIDDIQYFLYLDGNLEEI